MRDGGSMRESWTAGALGLEREKERRWRERERLRDDFRVISLK